SLEPYQNGYALVMEDFGGVSLKEWGVESGEWGLGESVESLVEFLQIAIALCDALDILIRNRIIHKDIKPANSCRVPSATVTKVASINAKCAEISCVHWEPI
ncbi:hypothetical protein, partial [Nostoc sp.]|uniref:hypothetical protein n=1 Tax=Nostoc sp. TaxID=1180 RepID=UPI002FF713D8